MPKRKGVNSKQLTNKQFLEYARSRVICKFCIPRAGNRAWKTTNFGACSVATHDVGNEELAKFLNNFYTFANKIRGKSMKFLKRCEGKG